MIFLPIHTKTKDNQRGHWSKKHKDAATERSTAFWAVKALTSRPAFPVKVTITRCGPRRLDRQNLGSALKSIVDGIADAYGVDDGDERWEFVFTQKQQMLYGVDIKIEALKK